MLAKKVTLRDVAKAASVSLGTASRAINGHSSVKPEIRERVEVAIRELNYQPNPIAQSMRTGATRTIGCILRNLKTPVMTDFVQSAESLIRPAGYALILATTNDSRESERAILQTFSQRFVDGLLLTVRDESDPDLLGLLRSINIPVVLLDRKLAADFDSVVVDHRSGLQQATSHLIGLGHRRIALLAGNPVVYPSRDSIAGYEAAYRKAGLAWDPSLIMRSDFWESTAFRLTTDLMTSGNPPTAIISGGTMMLPGVIKAVRELGLSVPKDVSLVAGYDSDLARLVSPAISAIQKDFAMVGLLGTELLLQRLENGLSDEPRAIQVPSSFIERDSCAKAPAA